VDKEINLSIMKFYQVKSKEVINSDLWNRVKGEYDGITMKVETFFTKGESDNRYHAVFSSEIVDRHGEIVFQNFDLKPFKKNPVYLDSHNYSSIEHIIGKIVGMKVKDGQLQGDVVFALDNPKGLLAMKLVEGGFLNTSSIGFIPLDFDEKGNITKSELLEISGVSVPANAEALFEKVVKEFAEQQVEEEEEVEEVEEETETEEEIEEEAEDEGSEEEIEEDTENESDEEKPTEEEVEKTVEKPNLYKQIIKMREEQVKFLKEITEGLNASNHYEKKRKVYKAIRDAFKSR